MAEKGEDHRHTKNATNGKDEILHDGVIRMRTDGYCNKSYDYQSHQPQLVSPLNKDIKMPFDQRTQIEKEVEPPKPKTQESHQTRSPPHLTKIREIIGLIETRDEQNQYGNK